MAPTLAEATAVETINSHTYAATLDADWSVGSVPHGGVVASVFLRAADAHFAGTLAARRQPHTIALHLEFLRRTRAGPAVLTVCDAKLGRRTSTIHITLSQDPDKDLPLVVGYITRSDVDAETGPSLATGWALDDPPPAPVDLAALAARGEDAAWAELTEKPFPNFRRVMSRVRQYLPKQRQSTGSDGRRRAFCDEWLRLPGGERFTEPSLGFVSDFWPQIMETVTLRAEEQQPGVGEAGKKKKAPPPMWYPTLVLNLDVKKPLPPAGVEWLFVRVRAKAIRKGRQDLEVVILDESGDLVAVSHHVALAVSAERNLAGRGSRAGGGSKL